MNLPISNHAAAPKRLLCARCQRPQSACICRWITPVANRVPVLILQHPLEAGQAKNSAGLLHLSLADSRIEIGERFDQQHLRALLGPGSVLLYPADAADPHAPASPSAAPWQLVVLDATWRKSRKMLHQNPLLRQLPRLALAAPPPSHYHRIRRAHAPHQLATLEAVCQALPALEGDAVQPACDALLHAFDGFVAQQLGYRPDASERSS
ncbi:MAG: tRNA-uridine aminocarboxypropyltransferase [Burkholderiaceae bacterium]